jgi:DNA topoisomerase-1
LPKASAAITPSAPAPPAMSSRRERLTLVGDSSRSALAAMRDPFPAAVRQVAEYLGNTPAVCRSAYIDPRVFDRFRSGVTICSALGTIEALDPEALPALQGSVDEAVLDLLSEGTEPAGKAA